MLQNPRHHPLLQEMKGKTSRKIFRVIVLSLLHQHHMNSCCFKVWINTTYQVTKAGILLVPPSNLCWASDKKFRRRASSMKSGSSTALPVIVKKSFEWFGSNCFYPTFLLLRTLPTIRTSTRISKLLSSLVHFNAKTKSKVISVHIECLLKRVYDVGKYLSRSI